MNVAIEKWSLKDANAVVDAFLKRPPFDAKAQESARAVLAAIREKGEEAIISFASEFDGVTLRPGGLAVERAELAGARATVDDDAKNAMRQAHSRIFAFAKAGLRRDWTVATPRGGVLGEQFVPLDRVGVYVPGGAAPLVSTALMTVTLAKVAGVPEIVVCTPSGPDGTVNPALLFAIELAGATEIYRVGGIQAIGLMAYGLPSVPKVQKIVGPGGTYVTAAKRLVYGDVALDLVAGPSEIAVLADETADAKCVAADLLSQAEHGTGWEKSLFVTPVVPLARAVQAELQRQVEKLSRKAAVEKVAANGGMLIVVVNNLDEGMELCNRFAAEHLELMVREPQKWPRKVRSAGGIFMGPWSPEAAGDFVAGPSHVLPTGGAAAMFSGLMVEDFRRRHSIISLTRADLADMLPVIEVFGRLEGMDAHARSARMRFEQS